MKLSFLCCFLLSICTTAFATFPTEEQVRNTLKTDMTPGEVTAIYGTPGGTGSSDYPGARVFSYLSPVNSRTREVEGYVGFTVIFRDGRLVDWQPIRTTPSYDPDMHARDHLMPFAWEQGLIFIGVFAFGVSKAFRFATDEHRKLINAFKDRTIPTRTLPPDFRFINRDTTLQGVIDRVGPFTRATQRVIRGTAGGFRTIDTVHGLPGIITYDFEMPYRAEVVVMPEHPFEPDSRIRAVYYRPPRTDEE